MRVLKTLFFSTSILVFNVFAAKNCTHDPWTYITHPFLYLASHPFLTLEIDILCKDIRHFTHLLTDVNVTHIIDTHPNLDLNATEITTIISNVTSELSLLQNNATLVRLCNRARDVENSCWPLVYDTWKLNKPECRAAPLKNDTDAAGKNKTLVEICDVFVDGCNKNKTVTDAALTAADTNSSSTSASTSTAASSSSTATSTSGAVHVEGLRGGLFVSGTVVLLGLFMVG